MTDIARLRRNRFAVVGRVGMDVYADPPGTRLEDAPKLVACLGGSPANMAVAIAKLGGQASLVTTVSDDAIGRFCLNGLDRYGVNRDHVRVVEGPRRTSLVAADSRLDDHQCVLYRNSAADFLMNTADVEALDYGAYGGLIITGTAFAEEPSRSASFRSLELARSAGLPLILDIDYRPHSWSSASLAADTLSRAGESCDIVVGNDVEFDFMAGAPGEGLEKARALASSTAEIAVYKKGGDGAVTISREGEFATGVFSVEALKPIGAGDGFMGGFISGLAAGKTLVDAVVQGSASAAIVVSRVGCSPAMPDAEELDRFIATNSLGTVRFREPSPSAAAT